MSRILLVSNEKSTSAILTKLMKTEGYKILPATDVASAKTIIDTEEFNLMIAIAGKGTTTDMVVEAISCAQAKNETIPVIAITENDAGATAARLSTLKLFGCLEKPLKVDKLVAMVQRAVDRSDTLATGNANLNLQLETCYQFENIIAESPAMKSVCDMISRVAATDVTILLAGESGTGKELMARTIHTVSRRKDKAIVVIPCAASDADMELFTRGGLEKASGGTLVLQEINRLALPAQQSLLKCLQERKWTKPVTNQTVPVDVRIVATTSENLQQLTAEGKFMPELFKLIKVIYLQIAPLRDRRQDIMPSVRHSMRNILGEGQVLPVLDADVADILQSYNWPGNSGEVDSVMAAALKAAAGGKITKSCLPPELTR